jgi:hypothetical protein
LEIWPLYGDDTPGGSVIVGDPYVVSDVLGTGD